MPLVIPLKLIMSKFWSKVAAYTILESLVAMLILSICISLFISMEVTIFTAQTSLDKCMTVIQFENNQILTYKNLHANSDSTYITEIKSYSMFDILEIKNNNNKVEWSLWQVLKNK